MTSKDYYKDARVRVEREKLAEQRIEAYFNTFWGIESLPPRFGALNLRWDGTVRLGNVPLILDLYWNKYYNINCVSFIVGVSTSYVRQVLSGDKGGKAVPSYRPTEQQRRNRVVVDHLLSLRGLERVFAEERHKYIGLLKVLGFTYEQVQRLFGGNKEQFLMFAYYRNGMAWKEFCSELVGVQRHDFRKLWSS